MNAEGGHGGIEGAVIERQSLGHGVDGGGEVRGTLGAHGGGGLHRRDAAVRRLIRARARPHIEHTLCGAERGEDDGGDAGIGLAVAAIVASDAAIVRIARTAVPPPPVMVMPFIDPALCDRSMTVP